MSEILLRQGIKHKYAEEKAARMAQARKIAHAKGKLFTATERIRRREEEGRRSRGAAAAAAQTGRGQAGDPGSRRQSDRFQLSV